MPDEIEMIPVVSDLLDAVGFNPATGEGRGAFPAKGSRSGSIYSYPNCTQEEFDQILSGAIGGSIGKTFNQLWKWKSGYQRIS